MKRKHWTRGDLIIALYIAKFGLRDIDMTRTELVSSVLKGTTLRSLNMQIANFRFLLNLEGVKLTATSKSKLEIVEEYGNTSRLNLRLIVTELINTGTSKKHSESVLEWICNRRQEYKYRILREEGQLRGQQGVLF
jgi:hypothetical protein